MLVCPKVDERTAEDIVAEVRALMQFHVPDLHGRQPAGQLSEALTRVVARYSELIVDRLNRAPEKNLLAFLDMIGIAPLPPRAARVPLTFYLSAPNIASALVPARSLVAAEQAEGEKTPAIFETEADLPVIAAKLSSLFAEYPSQDSYRDWQHVLAPPTPSVPPGLSIVDPEAAPILPNQQPLPHVLYVAIPARSAWPANNRVGLRFQLQASADVFSDPFVMQWELCTAPTAPAPTATKLSVSMRACDNVPAVPLSPEVDETASFSKSGEVVFKDLAPGPPLAIEGVAAHWVRARLTTPISQAPTYSPNLLRAAYLPTVQSVRIHNQSERTNLPLDAASSNSVKLDISKDFFPFGERPRFGDTFYLACDAFTEPDADLIIHIQLTNPQDATQSPIPVVTPNGARVEWQYWDGTAWRYLGVGAASSPVRGPVGAIRLVEDFSDQTRAFSVSGDVKFRFPAPPQQAVVNGQKGYWIRGRLAAGDFGREATYSLEHESRRVVMTPTTLAPPSIKAIRLDVKVNCESKAAAIVTCNDFVTERVKDDSPFQPFTPSLDLSLSQIIYFGLESTMVSPPAAVAATLTGSPMTSRIPGQAMCLYAATDNRVRPDTGTLPAVPLWEYWNGAQWTKWSALDDTRGLSRTGVISALLPDDFVMREKFGVMRFWLRMHGQDPGFDPIFRMAVLNTTMAHEGVTMRNQVLGSSNGRPSQTFQLANAPVLEGQQLQVREPVPPIAEDAVRILLEEGRDAVSSVPLSEGNSGEVWVRWHEVANLRGSESRDRHYVLDRTKGVVVFGDGVNGRVPPHLPGNIRMVCYRVGGGARGNKGALAIKQFKSSIPFVNKAINWEFSSGGIDAESTPALIERAPRWLRHRNRAVTPEDFEDISRMASPLVARAKCYSISDLEKDRTRRSKYPGVVSVVVVPVSASPAPAPTQALLDDVRSALERAMPPVTRLVMVEPRYFPVDVEVKVVINDARLAGPIDQAITAAIQMYLHPVTGTRSGAGWDFERVPRHSDLCGLIEDVPGVSHVDELRLSLRFSSELLLESGDFLICPGNQKVTLRPSE